MYEDTKIRLHFSNFKVLDSARDTCFIDPPHQCSDLTAEQPVEDRGHHIKSGSTGNEL